MSVFTFFITAGMSAQADLSVLPQNAQDFINEHFSGINVVSAEEEDDALSKDENEAYEVKLENGIKIDFGQNGDVTEIESENGEMIPDAAIPENVKMYIDSNYAGQDIMSWERDNDEQEVKLADGTELEFDDQGEFLRED